MQAILHQPSHPYTAGLMAAIPDMAVSVPRLRQIDGAMPRLDAVPAGCSFHPRCPQAFARCHEARPELLPARCHRGRLLAA